MVATVFLGFLGNVRLDWAPAEWCGIDSGGCDLHGCVEVGCVAWRGLCLSMQIVVVNKDCCKV